MSIDADPGSLERQKMTPLEEESEPPSSLEQELHLLEDIVRLNAALENISLQWYEYLETKANHRTTKHSTERSEVLESAKNRLFEAYEPLNALRYLDDAAYRTVVDSELLDFLREELEYLDNWNELILGQQRRKLGTAVQIAQSTL